MLKEVHNIILSMNFILKVNCEEKGRRNESRDHYMNLGRCLFSELLSSTRILQKLDVIE